MSGGVRIRREELRYQREKRILSRRALARKARVAQSTYYALEAGYQVRARPETIRKIAAALGCKPAALVAVERRP